ncbi:MAG: OmpA family protein [Bacteroidota bacterium]
MHIKKERMINMRVENKKAIYLVVGILLALLSASSVFAQKEDVKGSKDHPLISRYSGSIIINYDVKEFDQYTLVLGKLDKERNLTKSQKLEGKVTQISYSAPKGRTIFEIYRNYESALRNGGFEILFSVTSKELDWYNFVNIFESAIYRSNDKFYDHMADNGRYLAAKLTRPEGDVYVAIAVGISIWVDSPRIQVDVIEEKPMTTGKVKVEINAEAMAEDINEKGSVRIYGIHFDTDKATIREDSESTLTEIAKLLEQKPELNLGVVGHTDATGNEEHNMDLSKRRAEAVVEFLTSEQNISADRLKPRGLGPWAPVASNEDKDGRAQNRRVELVKIVDE